MHTDDSTADALGRLERRLARERTARLEAEATAERGMRELYEKQQEVLLLTAIAVAANEAATIQDAMQNALDQVCAHTGWPVGHAYLLAPGPGLALAPTTWWHLRDPERFQAFREITEATTFPPGIGLPGRVLATGKPVWIMDVNKDDNFPRAKRARDIKVKAGFGFPVLAGRTVVGVLEFFSEDAIPPNERLLEMMAHIGTQLGRVVERKQAEDRIRHLAYHDALTELPNRALFQDRFSIALAQAHRTRQNVLVMSLDLDRFKVINDTLGHIAGDHALQVTAKRLTECLREGDTIARLGGDEFMLLLPGIHWPEEGAKIAQKLLTAFRLPLRFEGREFYVTPSIGIAFYPDDGTDTEALMKNADAAMYRAKELGRNSYQLYTSEMNSRAIERLGLESELRRALKDGQFTVHYQPQFSIDRSKIVGAEALVRWHHPERGLVPPGDFIPLAEETGLIVPLGEWVLRTACRQTKTWLDAGLAPLRMSVNLSMRQFHQPDFLATVTRVLEETRLDPQHLELELTESIAMQEADSTAQLLGDLHRMGIRVSLDDFGTGYSSLRYLKQLPIHTLKIDRSFVQDLASDADDAAIVANIIRLGHSLKLNVIAEGVETEEQLALLSEGHCDEFQGFLCSRPVPAAEFEAILRRHRTSGTDRAVA